MVVPSVIFPSTIDLLPECLHATHLPNSSSRMAHVKIPVEYLSPQSALLPQVERTREEEKLIKSQLRQLVSPQSGSSYLIYEVSLWSRVCRYPG